jgi:hypothetical protein
MKTPSLSDLKRELGSMPPAELVNLCIHLAKFKKENKELLSYLLFDSNYEPDFIERIKNEMDQLFSEINKSNLYYFKKGLRRILRTTNKYIKYSGKKQTEAELRLHYCYKLKTSGISLTSSTAIHNIYSGQLLKINAAVAKLHEDLQHDYRRVITKITEE